MRHVGEQGAERHDELDAELAREPDDLLAQNVRQRMFGSMPRRRTASRSVPGTSAW